MKIARLLVFLLPLNIYCQDLTGTWIGRESGVSYLKLVIVQTEDSCFGYTYDEGPGFCKANFAGKFDGANQKLKGKGIGFIEKSFGHVLAVYNLNYQKDGEDEYLQGTAAAKGVGSTILSLGIPSFARLKKLTSDVDTTRFMLDRTIAFNEKNKFADSVRAGIKEDSRVSINEEAFVGTGRTFIPDTIANVKAERISRMVKTIYTNADTVKMFLYDNGIVDDDTVTVFFDNAVILDHYRITDSAKELLIPLTGNGQSHSVELFANNLGTIPPNTALIVIMAGKERYEVHASYDLSTNAKIILQYKE